MEIIFKNENVIVEKEEHQGKSEIFVRALKGDLLAAHSLAVQVNYLQEQKELLSETVMQMQMQTATQPMATLEHTSEPDLRHYHYYAEQKFKSISLDGYFSCTWSGNGEGASGELVESVKQSICELAWQNKMIKSNPEDWVIKSLSRL